MLQREIFTFLQLSGTNAMMYLVMWNANGSYAIYFTFHSDDDVLYCYRLASEVDFDPIIDC